jgi:hypothetical protein
VQIGRSYRVPTLNDAAADVPPGEPLEVHRMGSI